QEPSCLPFKDGTTLEPHLKLPIKRLRLKLIRITNIVAHKSIIHRLHFISNGNLPFFEKTYHCGNNIWLQFLLNFCFSFFARCSSCALGSWFGPPQYERVHIPHGQGSKICRAIY